MSNDRLLHQKKQNEGILLGIVVPIKKNNPEGRPCTDTIISERCCMLLVASKASIALAIPSISSGSLVYPASLQAKGSANIPPNNGFYYRAGHNERDPGTQLC